MLMARFSSTDDVITAFRISVANCSRYLVSKGALVDKIGGDLKSTPLHWATR